MFFLRHLFSRRAGGERDDAPGFTEGRIEYAVVAVAGAGALVSARMGRVATLAHEYGGDVDAMTSGIVVVAFGTLPRPLPRGDRHGFVRAVAVEMGIHARVVHGAGDGHFGLLGGPGRVAYGFVLPGFADSLASLAALPAGGVHEIPSAGPRPAR